jgi:opacity protein-like surface antigen
MAFTRASLILGAAVLLGTVQGAAAADLGDYGRGGSLKDGYAAPTEPSHRSWYVRIDGGYSLNETPDISETLCTPCGAKTYELTNTDFANTWSFGGGVGMHFTNRIRGDITYDHRFSGDVKGDLNIAPPLGTRTFGLQSDVVLANLYYDFDFGSRFTPYVGGGIGWVRNETEAGTVVSCGCATGTIAPGTSNNFAGALMTGVSVNLWGGEQQVMGGGMKDGPMYVDSGRKLALDFGYRFLFLGDAATGPVSNVVGVSSDDPTMHDVHAHELRLGLRYDLN